MTPAQQKWVDAHGFETVSEADLDWWLSIADDLEWREAKTYRDHTPHTYLLRHVTRLTREQYAKVHRVIVTFGIPQKFYRGTNMYLTSRDGGTKWFLAGPEEVNLHNSLINRDQSGRIYGVQDAPKISSPAFTIFDAISSDYNYKLPKDRDATVLWQFVNEMPLRGNAHPTVLDVGCGTGRAIASKLVHGPDQWTGVDSSLGMLNQLLLRHWKYKDMHCMTFADFLLDDDRMYDTVLVLGATSTFLSPDELHGAIRRATRQVIIETSSGGLAKYLMEHYQTATKRLGETALIRIEVPA